MCTSASADLSRKSQSWPEKPPIFALSPRLEGPKGKYSKLAAQTNRHNKRGFFFQRWRVSTSRSGLLHHLRASTPPTRGVKECHLSCFL